MTIATVELSRDVDGKHRLAAQSPSGAWVSLNLEEIHVPGIAAFIKWADYNLNRPATPIEELVDDFQQAVYEDTVNRATYSHAQSTVAEDKAKLLAAITHLKANHAEMVARNKLLRDRPDLPQECGHPKQCIGQVNDEVEHCLWCGDITDMKMLVNHLTTIYDSITDGRISKPTTLPSEVIDIGDDLETERTEAAVKDALAEAGEGDSYRNKLYDDWEEIVPYTGHFEPGHTVTIHWKPIEGEVGGPTVDHGYVFVYPNEDEDVGACVHIPKPDPRGDRDVSPEWPTVAELLSNPLIERIEFTEPPHNERLEVGVRQSALSTSADERYEREVAMLRRLDYLGVIHIQRESKLLSEVMIADKHLNNESKAA